MNRITDKPTLPVWTNSEHFETKLENRRLQDELDAAKWQRNWLLLASVGLLVFCLWR